MLAADAADLDHPVVVELPLRGEWTVERTPAHRIPSHGTDVLGMRYAYDFIRTDDRPRPHVHPAGSATPATPPRPISTSN